MLPIKKGWIVCCDFRAKNGFGALVLESKWFIVKNGRVIDVQPFSAYKLWHLGEICHCCCVAVKDIAVLSLGKGLFGLAHDVAVYWWGYLGMRLASEGDVAGGDVSAVEPGVRGLDVAECRCALSLQRCAIHLRRMLWNGYQAGGGTAD